jgi:hypothetical protein
MVLGIEGPPGGVPNQIAGKITAAVGVDLLMKPLKERLVVALIQFVLKAGQIPVGGPP